MTTKIQDGTWQQLEEAALEVQHHAYAPYSHFKVGAALITADGNIYRGCNVENVSYGLAICAERSAISAMVSAGEDSPVALVIVTKAQQPGPPCGMCRQVLAEFADELPIRLISTTPGVEPVTTTLSALLPMAFRPNMLPSSR